MMKLVSSLRIRSSLRLVMFAGGALLMLTGCSDPLQHYLTPSQRSWSLIASTIIMVGLLVVIVRRRNIPTAEELQNLERKLAAYHGEKVRIDRELEDAQAHMRELAEQIASLRRQDEGLDGQNGEAGRNQAEETESVMPGTIVYLTTPESDGTFDDHLRSERYISGESIYVLSIDPRNRSSAAFELIMHRDALDLALRRRERLIEPYCESINSFKPGTSGVETLELGTLVLSGGRWTLLKKAQIKYI